MALLLLQLASPLGIFGVLARNCRQIVLISWVNVGGLSPHQHMKDSCVKNVRTVEARTESIFNFVLPAEQQMYEALKSITKADTKGCLNSERYGPMTLYPKVPRYDTSDPHGFLMRRYFVYTNRFDFRINSYRPSDTVCWYPVAASVLPRVHKDRGCNWYDINADLTNNAYFNSTNILSKASLTQAPANSFFYSWVFDNKPEEMHLYGLNTNVHCQTPHFG
ncbi:hypothetical protein BCR37DRAFT_388169 [Protomyces lactucae-debilis]|uniref:Uncharacterized protein n=1 Tax=Protomyces lactucae-debilis TaxID=2754530 RepID=A0A1Y2FAH8_PROLT|nr:uncharacterized protein BCR37DRAFT_388169 [Protomyces lactucae-debilis]ORY80454.1 hypothetical protein BCR37DRAFT_388169 [Protomyces lactucae-debilis]